MLEQKKFYTDLELKHSSIITFLNENCGGEFSQIFFFYSNVGDKQEESELMGSILGTFRRANQGKVMVYSFDYNLDYKTIYELKGEYNISQAPIVLVNEEETIYVRNINDLDGYFSNV